MESRLGLKGIKASLHMIVCLSAPSLLLLSLSMGISIKSSGLGACKPILLCMFGPIFSRLWRCFSFRYHK